MFQHWPEAAVTHRQDFSAAFAVECLTSHKHLLICIKQMSTTAIFRALADPTRLAIFECVAVQELSVSELTGRFEVSQPAISQHLSALRNSGLVAYRRDGKNIYYRADPKGMLPMIDWLNHYRAFWKSKLPRLESLLKELRDDK